MSNKEFSSIRKYLGKTQEQLANLLCVSCKAVQSYEQAWRPIPPYVERQMLFLLSLKKAQSEPVIPCWTIRECPQESREKCIVWELQAKTFCLFMNGTYCQGEIQKDWKTKIDLCRDCEVYKNTLPAIQPDAI